MDKGRPERSLAMGSAPGIDPSVIKGQPERLTAMEQAAEAVEDGEAGEAREAGEAGEAACLGAVQQTLRKVMTSIH